MSRVKNPLKGKCDAGVLSYKVIDIVEGDALYGVRKVSNKNIQV